MRFAPPCFDSMPRLALTSLMQITHAAGVRKRQCACAASRIDAEIHGLHLRQLRRWFLIRARLARRRRHLYRFRHDTMPRDAFSQLTFRGSDCPLTRAHMALIKRVRRAWDFIWPGRFSAFLPAQRSTDYARIAKRQQRSPFSIVSELTSGAAHFHHASLISRRRLVFPHVYQLPPICIHDSPPASLATLRAPQRSNAQSG